MSKRFHGRLQTGLEAQEDGKIVEFAMLVRTRRDLYPLHLPEEKSHQVEHVNWRFIEKASGEARVPNPGRTDQFAAVHFGMYGKRLKFAALDRLPQNLINRGKPAVVTHLIDHAGAHGSVAQSRG